MPANELLDLTRLGIDKDVHPNLGLTSGIENLHLESEFPAVTVFSTNELSGSLGICSLHFLLIPINALACANRHIPKKYDFGERTGAAEIG